MAQNSFYRIIGLVCMILTSFNICHAQQELTKEQLSKGIEAFQGMNFDKAISYLSPIEDDLENIDIEAKTTLSFVLGTCYHQTGNLEKALSLYKIVLKSSSLDNNIVIQLRPTLLEICTVLEDDNAALLYLTEVQDLMNKPNFRQSGFYSDYAISVCTYYTIKKQYKKVLEYAEKGLSVIDSEDKEEQLKGAQKNTLYMFLGNANRELGHYEQAVENLKNALLYISYTKQDCCVTLHAIGNCYNHANQSDSALIYMEKAEILYGQRNAPIDNVRINNSLELGVLLSNKGESQRAMGFLLDAENGYKELGNSDRLPYVYAHLYNCSKSIGNKELTNKYAERINEYIKYVKNDNSREYNICYSAYASILESEGKYSEAITIMKNLTDAENLNDETVANDLATSYYKLAVMMIQSGDFIHAEINIRKTLELLDPVKNRSKDLFIGSQILLSEVLSKTGRIGESIRNLENIKSFVTSADGHDDAASQYYSFLAGLYASIGNNDKILEYELRASEVTLKNKGEESYDYAISLINLSEAYGLSLQKEKANECLNVAAEIISKLYGEESKEYYNVLHKQALNYSIDSSRTVEAEKVFNKCLNLSKKCFGNNSIQHGEDLCWYAMFRFYSMQDNHAIEFMQKGINILSAFEDYEGSLLHFLNQLSILCHVSKDYELAYSYDKQYYERVKDFLKQNFPNLVDWQRESLWTPIHNNLSKFISAASATSSSLYLKLAYNSLLLGKGLLLQSSNNIANAVKQNGDAELLKIHDQIQIEKKKLLNSTKQNDIEEIRNNINSLQRAELNKISDTDILKGLFDTEWTDVCDNLEEGDVAIEFASYPTQDCNSYVAFVLNCHSRQPLCIPLFNDKELARFVSDDNVQYDYQNPDLYRVIWERLETYALKNAKRIYFAPDGLLHKIAIENLVDKQGRLASDKWNLHRLTSTRNVVRSAPHNTYKSAVLYGGLTYTMDANDLEEATKLRAGVEDLAETKVEITGIQAILEENSIDCKLKTEKIGTEESFMSLSSIGVNILHLATHGFFWTSENEKEYSNVQFISLINNTNSKESALLRSGLLLSGANIALQGKRVSNGVQDGILTAQEISSLDFEDMDLVVLSACETALGEISGEGVFGLQRGFKLVGAQSILMSLWKVDDTATRLLMTEFYNHLLHGCSKIESLKRAQMNVRMQSGYEDPEYWAGFILLDGLD